MRDDEPNHTEQKPNEGSAKNLFGGVIEQIGSTDRNQSGHYPTGENEEGSWGPFEGQGILLGNVI